VKRIPRAAAAWWLERGEGFMVQAGFWRYGFAGIGVLCCVIFEWSIFIEVNAPVSPTRCDDIRMMGHCL
jgi:uncharacterized membrane protein YhiD involved in acid resistance